MTSLDLTTDEAIAETKKGSGVAEENVAGFPSDETRTVVPENSLHIEKVSGSGTSNGDIFTGIAGLITGLSGLLNPVEELVGLIATIRKDRRINITYQPRGPKDHPTLAVFTVQGVRVNDLKWVIAQLESWPTKKNPRTMSFVEDQAAQSFIEEHR